MGTIVILRGLVREAGHWGPFPDRLAARLSVSDLRKPDHAGTGTEIAREALFEIGAMVADLRARVGELQPPALLFGMSLGGMVALEWAHRHPEDFGTVVVCNTSARDLGGPLQRFRLLGAWTALGVALTRDPHAKERAIVGLVANHPAEGTDVVADRQGRIAAQRPVTAQTAYRQVRAASRFRVPERFDVPVRVLCSAGDRLVDPGCSRRLAARFQFPIDEHPTGGHDLVLDDPDWVVERIAEAWATLTPSAAAPPPR